MPTSCYQAIPAVLEHVLVEEPISVLDVGVGFGKYGLLLRESLDVGAARYRPDEWRVQIDGVEAYPDYRNPVYDHVYNKVYFGDIRQVIDTLGTYDVVLAIDVLEHFTKEEGHLLLNKLLEHARKAVVISTPLYPAPQSDYRGNAFEAHKSRWHVLDVVHMDATYQLVPTADGGAQVIKIYPAVENANNVHELDKWWCVNANVQRRPLRISYLLPHQRLTGGLKLLLRQASELQRRGHEIWVFYKGTSERAVPDWAEGSFANQIVIRPGETWDPYVRGSDLVVAGWIDQLLQLQTSDIPVLYWEQGSEWLFGDSVGQNPHVLRRYLRACYSQPYLLSAVSSTVQAILEHRFSRLVPVIPNGIDTTAFHPRKEDRSSSIPVIMLVGNPELWFKGFDVAFAVLERLWKRGYRFRVLWVAPTPPADRPTPFDVFVVVNPQQDELPEWYREADLLLFTSWYEGFGMPPLEAMATGLPVVSTSCGGVKDYAIHGENALLAEPGDVEQLAKHVATLLTDEVARRQLGVQARATAMRFDWTRIGDMVEDYFYKAAFCP